MQARRGMAEVQLLGDGDEIAQVAKLNIHTHTILIKTNGILDVLVPTNDTGRMELIIRPLRDEADAAAFRALNEEWIARYFAIEAQDRRQLDDPIAAYIDTGGEILIAERDGRAVGCVALMPDGTGAYELSKMAIAPELRGQGAGRTLLSAAIDHAQGRRREFAVPRQLPQARQRGAPLRGAWLQACGARDAAHAVCTRGRLHAACV